MWFWLTCNRNKHFSCILIVKSSSILFVLQKLYLKNLPRNVSKEDLAQLFVRFESTECPNMEYRVLEGRMKGQAFVTFKGIHFSVCFIHLLTPWRLGSWLIIWVLSQFENDFIENEHWSRSIFKICLLLINLHFLQIQKLLNMPWTLQMDSSWMENQSSYHLAEERAADCNDIVSFNYFFPRIQRTANV